MGRVAYATHLVRSSVLSPQSSVLHATAGLLGLVLCLLVYQAPTTYRLDLAEADPSVITGFGPAEENEGGGFRWMASRAVIPLPPVGAPATLRITAIGWRPNDLPTPTLQASLDDRPLGVWPTTRADGVFEAAVPRQWLAPTGGMLILGSDTFTPGAQDRRRLGVAVRSVE